MDLHGGFPVATYGSQAAMLKRLRRTWARDRFRLMLLRAAILSARISALLKEHEESGVRSRRMSLENAGLKLLARGHDGRMELPTADGHIAILSLKPLSPEAVAFLVEKVEDEPRDAGGEKAPVGVVWGPYPRLPKQSRVAGLFAADGAAWLRRKIGKSLSVSESEELLGRIHTVLLPFLAKLQDERGSAWKSEEVLVRVVLSVAMAKRQHVPAPAEFLALSVASGAQSRVLPEHYGAAISTWQQRVKRLKPAWFAKPE